MRSVVLDNQEILHCANCGSSFFEDNGINRISIDRARQLAKERYKQGLTPSYKPNCPRDEAVLKLLSNTEAIPPTVRLYQCPECLGILAPADDLELFKRAQLSKLDYFKAWGLPLGSLRGVLAIGLLFLLSGSLYWSYNSINREAIIRSEADGLLQNIDVSFAGRYMFIGFKTNTPLKSSILIEDKETRRIITVPVSATLKTIHTVTLTAPANTDNFIYRVRIQDKDGRTVETKQIDL